jgi:pyruvyltransferase
VTSLTDLKKTLRHLKRGVTERVRGPENPVWPQASYPTVELVYWRPKGHGNFGDELSRVVVELMLAKRGITALDEIPSRRRMLAIGSILHLAANDTVVWGTGRNGVIPNRAHFFDRLDVRSVRGPRTAAFLETMGITAPKVYGDPALLLPRLIGDRFAGERRNGPVFVPNLNDFRAGLDLSRIAIPTIDPRRSWNLVVPQILSYDFVIASSLHGLIVAEAFGIPARYVRMTEEESLFKYEDYYLGTGRTEMKAARSIEEAQSMGGERPPEVDLDLLANTFPYDVWGR